jgi:hypothetical protein
MFGLGNKDDGAEKLIVQVHAVAGADVFDLARKLWDENARGVRLDAVSGKEYLHFRYTSPKCAIWFQRDHGRTDVFEVMIRWESSKTYEVYVLSDGQPVGNQQRAIELLQSMLTTPSVIAFGG